MPAGEEIDSYVSGKPCQQKTTVDTQMTPVDMQINTVDMLLTTVDMHMTTVVVDMQMTMVDKLVYQRKLNCSLHAHSIPLERPGAKLSNGTLTSKNGSLYRQLQYLEKRGTL